MTKYYFSFQNCYNGGGYFMINVVYNCQIQKPNCQYTIIECDFNVYRKYLFSNKSLIVL